MEHVYDHTECEQGSPQFVLSLETAAARPGSLLFIPYYSDSEMFGLWSESHFLFSGMVSESLWFNQRIWVYLVGTLVSVFQRPTITVWSLWLFLWSLDLLVSHSGSSASHPRKSLMIPQVLGLWWSLECSVLELVGVCFTGWDVSVIIVFKLEMGCLELRRARARTAEVSVRVSMAAYHVISCVSLFDIWVVDC